MTGTVHVVHSVDTEGPLYEPIEVTFQRLYEIFGLNFQNPDHMTLEMLRKGDIDLNGREADVAAVLSGHLINYNDTWDKIQLMLDEIMSSEYRRSFVDSFGGYWKFSWHCLDHVGFEYNPRRRDMGYHNIFDYYSRILKANSGFGDDIQWHFHPMSTYKDAHRCATSFVNSPELYQILSRRIIEREWFPAVFRAGFQAERPDSNWFLEQWIPFDLSNMATDDTSDLDSQIDFKNGRSGNWRNAPADWTVYHPSHDHYQVPGACRRWIARSLNILNRMASIDEREVEKAFSLAQTGKSVLMGVSSHDFRDLRTEVTHVHELIRLVTKRHPDVKYKFSTGLEAFRDVVYGGKLGDPVELSVKFVPATVGDVPNISIKRKKGAVFGPQPYLAIQTKSRKFIHDNLDIIKINDHWGYAFHGDTLPLDDVRAIGVACNDRFGNTFVKKIEF